jgi:tripartite-type tricarboxylate transporter receptor subunit TctC
MSLNIIKTSIVAGILATGLFALPATDAVAAPEPFYKGKVITIIIAFRPGGGYHLYSTMLSRYMKKHIPGAPPIVLQFMPGAGGVKAANYFYTIAPRNGTYMSLLSQTASLFQRLNRGSKKGYRYDASKFNYIGRLVSMDAAHMFYQSLPSRNLDTLKAGKPDTVIACTAGKAAQGYINAAALAAATGIKMKILTGYQGSRAQNLAMQRGECNYQPGAWNSWKARRLDWVQKGMIKPVALTAPQRHPDLPDVPTIVELATTPKLKRIMSFIAGYAAVGRAYAAPPNTPAARVATLRKAFNATVKDADFLKATAERNMLIGTATGQYVQGVVEGIIATPDRVVKETREMLGYR